MTFSNRELLCAASLLLCQTAMAGIDWNITGAGARAEGMAGAFTGIADDATSVVWNPAGLATLVRPEASIVMRSIGNTVAYDWSSDLNSLGLDDSETSDSHALINFLSYVHPFEMGGRKLVAGVALQSQLDGFGDEQTQSGYTDVNGNPILDSDKSTGGVNTITPGIGFHLNPVLSLGLAANVWTGSIEGDVVGHYDDGFNVYESGYSYTYDASGMNFNLGALMDFSLASSPMPLKIGLNLRTPFQLDLDYSDSDQSSGTISVDMPLMVSVGASWGFGEFLTVAADLEARQYGDSKIKTDGAEAPLADHKQDLMQFRLGGEYLFLSDFAVIPLRAGFRTVPTLTSDSDDVGSQTTYTQVNGVGFALGTGLIFEKMAFDLAFSSSNYENSFKSSGSEWLVTKDTINRLTLSSIFYF
ncbi:MAG: hypothetical protein KC518_02970 [Candidatus Cloacimonetes bacterium]|nr:hypothetical protein [Candidatus Cloacimonadota bacterium]